MQIEGAAGFDWDEGNSTKCRIHGVTIDEIEFVFSADPSVFGDRTGQAEARYNAVGVTDNGRAVFIVFTFRRRGGSRLIRPISARYMHKRESQTYERTKGA